MFFRRCVSTMNSPEILVLRNIVNCRLARSRVSKVIIVILNSVNTGLEGKAKFFTVNWHSEMFLKLFTAFRYKLLTFISRSCITV